MRPDCSTVLCPASRVLLSAACVMLDGSGRCATGSRKSERLSTEVGAVSQAGSDDQCRRKRRCQGGKAHGQGSSGLANGATMVPVALDLAALQGVAQWVSAAASAGVGVAGTGRASWGPNSSQLTGGPAGREGGALWEWKRCTCVCAFAASSHKLDRRIRMIVSPRISRSCCSCIVEFLLRAKKLHPPPATAHHHLCCS
jgi:hypothetical protein